MIASLALGPTTGALAGLVFSLLLLPFGINKAEWLMAVGTALGLFVGLMMLTEEEQRHTLSAHERGGQKERVGTDH